MCGICGCSENNLVVSHNHDESATENHHHNHDETRMIEIEQNVFAKNDQFAFNNKKYFLDKKIMALNIMSSPGSGKTTLLTKTIDNYKNNKAISVIVGDQHTQLDAEKLIKVGGNVLQVNTGRMCHLDAHLVGHAVVDLAVKENSLLFIENVGNLVCPALFNLGEMHKIVLLSVTEGDNKPLKYADMFRVADLMIINKIDLLPYVEFDIEKCIEYAQSINPHIEILTLSATQGKGLNSWYGWLDEKKFKD